MPSALRPLRDKRLALKRLLKTLDPQDPHTRSMRRRYKAVVDALKWLTVVAYGRLGFANSTFGRINAHEVVSFPFEEGHHPRQTGGGGEGLPGPAPVRGQPVRLPARGFPRGLSGPGAADRAGDAFADRTAKGLSVVRLPGDTREPQHIRCQPFLRSGGGRRP